MPRPRRIAAGGICYHVLNRANGGVAIFEEDEDYLAFERVLAEATEREQMRMLAYCIMPNHFHMVLWPRQDGDLSRFMGWFTLTHTRRWHAARELDGAGHLYQGRFKSFPIQRDGHLLTVCRYVERNPLRAGLVRRAENWRWSSLWRRQLGDQDVRALLTPSPVLFPENWCEVVNQPQTAKELNAIRTSIARGRPFGGGPWQKRAAAQLGLQSTFRSRGRPRRSG